MELRPVRAARKVKQKAVPEVRKGVDDGCLTRNAASRELGIEETANKASEHQSWHPKVDPDFSCMDSPDLIYRSP